MKFSFFQHLKSKAWWVATLFYSALIILTILAFVYAIFTFKTYVYHKKIAEINDKIAAYTSVEEKANEKEVFAYKKKVDDFAVIIGNHKISSNIFNFIESSTLPDVWFSSLNMSEATNEIRLVGETESMETLSKQFNVFERNKDYVKDITVLNSQVISSGRVNFILNISLDPKIFTLSQS